MASRYERMDGRKRRVVTRVLQLIESRRFCRQEEWLVLYDKRTAILCQDEGVAIVRRGVAVRLAINQHSRKSLPSFF